MSISSPDALLPFTPIRLLPVRVIERSSPERSVPVAQDRNKFRVRFNNDHSPRLAIPGHISDSDPALILNLPFVNNCTSSKSRSHTRTSRTILHFVSRMDIAFAVHTYIMYIIYSCTVCQYTHDHQSHLVAGGLSGNERFILSGWQRREST